MINYHFCKTLRVVAVAEAGPGSHSADNGQTPTLLLHSARIIYNVIYVMFYIIYHYSIIIIFNGQTPTLLLCPTQIIYNAMYVKCTLFDVNYFLQGSRDSKVLFLFDVLVLVFTNQRPAMYTFSIKCSIQVLLIFKSSFDIL